MLARFPTMKQQTPRLLGAPGSLGPAPLGPYCYLAMPQTSISARPVSSYSVPG